MSQPSDQNHDPDEFGALSGGVSSLRSRFEQMSQSDNSNQAPPKPPAKSDSEGAIKPAQTTGLSHTVPIRGKHATSNAQAKPGPPAVPAKNLRQPVSQTPAASLSKGSSPGSSGASDSSLKEGPPPKTTTGHTKKPSTGKLHAVPSAFGQEAPSLVPSKHSHNHSWGGHEHAFAKPTKVAPPKPPKPQPAAPKIISDNELEELRKPHHGHPHVSALANRLGFGGHASAGHSPTIPQEPFKPKEAPVVPPRPPKTDSSSESLLNLPGVVAALAVSPDGRDDAGYISSDRPSPTPTPPPLPSRSSEANATQQSFARRDRSLTTSRSTGSLINAYHASAAAPPLPARKQASRDLESYPGASAPLPPPQRTQLSSVISDSSASSSRSPSYTHTRAIPTPVPQAGNGTPPMQARSYSPNDVQTGAPLPPPPSRSLGPPATLMRQGLGSSAPTSSWENTDSESDDDIIDSYYYSSTASPAKLVRSPLSAGRPAGAIPGPSPTELPDVSRANRRAPTFKPDCTTSARSMFQCFALCGHTVATGSGDKVKVYRVGELATGMGEKLCTVGDNPGGKELKLTALEFRPPNHGLPPKPAVGVRSHGETADEGRYLWCGTRDGHLWELDVAEAQVVYSRTNVHTVPIHLLRRVGNKMISMDEGGKISIWLPSNDPDPSVAGLRLSNQPQTQRIAFEKGSHAMVLGQQLWVSTGPASSRNSKEVSKGPKIRIYNPFADDKPFNATSKAVGIPGDMALGVGAVTGGTIIPTKPDLVYLGHDSGHVSVWSRQTYECISVQRLGPHGVTALAGVIKYLWAANRTGSISVFDTSSVPWRAIKIWPAHKEPVISIRVDEHGIQKARRLQVASAGLDATVHVWDGALSFDWLQLEQSKRETEFCSYRNIKLLNVTFNIDAANPIALESSAENMDVFPSMLRNACQVGGDPKAGGVAADRPPDVIVFGFQELIDLESKKLTAKSLLLGGGKRKANDLGDRVSHQYRAWHDKLTNLVRLAMPPHCGYLMVKSESLVGLFTCVFVRQSEFRNVRETAISTVKTGMGGRYGNKGAVIARMVIDDTSICFTNCHLAAGQTHVKQRNADVADILESPTVFEDHHADPAAYVGGGDGSMILDHELCILSGDLNYRIDHKRDVVVNAVMANKLPPLIEADQLRKELKNNPTFRLKVFCEAPLNFPPTYKYDRGTNEWDTSEKNRVPAWCDRILWRSHRPDRIRCLEYRRWETTISDHRPVTAIFEAKVKAIDPARASKMVEELQEKWKGLHVGILDTAIAFYSNPV